MLHRSHSSRNATRGLTLIELMVGLSLMALLMTIAVPSFRAQIAASQLTSASNELAGTLARARSESIRMGQRVTVCKTGGSSSQCASGAADGWEHGWLVVQDSTRNSTDASVDSGETVTFVVSPTSGDLKIDGTADVASYVSFAATGQSKLMGGGTQAGTLRVCSTSPALRDDNRARDIVISSTGRIVVTKATAVASNCPA